MGTLNEMLLLIVFDLRNRTLANPFHGWRVFTQMLT